MTSRLTPRDIQSLLSNPSVDARAEVAAKVAQEVGGGVLSPREKEIAEQILRIMVKDAAERVRGALATSLAQTSDMPRDVAQALARDIDAIAVPFLEHTPVLSDKDLIELIRAGSTGKQQAIARRPSVPQPVADALVDTGEPDIVRTLVKNPGAALSEATLGVILDRHGADKSIADPMVARAELPLTVAERLVTLVSEQYRAQLVTRHKVPKHVAERLLSQSREKVTVDLLSAARDASKVAELVMQLRSTGRLTPSLLLRAACTGDMRFCEEAFALLAGLPVHKAWILLHDAGPLGLRAIYERSRMPEFLYPAFRVAFDVFHETPFDGEPQDRERFERRMLERILTQYDELAADDLDYLLDRLGQSADAEQKPQRRAAR